MRAFNVTVARTLTQLGTITVVAENAEEAQRIAEDNVDQIDDEERDEWGYTVTHVVSGASHCPTLASCAYDPSWLPWRDGPEERSLLELQGELF